MTDLIILVISAVESVQQQTVEVIEIIQRNKIPFIVAVNKIDKKSADLDATLLDLSTHNIDADLLGGDIPCVPISATEGIGISELQQKIKELSEGLDLKQD